jgi:endo-1,4-beta-D-glucanase Y/4-amino-4-deoxy-L-arabinose transferase-like glycosyltransferase
VAEAVLGRPRAGTLPDRAIEVALRSEPMLVLALAAVGFLSHALNLFHYPSFTLKDDEGIYASQAWAVLRQGALAPYTYWYDHAPFGWLLIAGWMALVGGPHAFGSALDTGRVFMLLVHVATVPLLYQVTRKLGAGVPAATLAVLLFSLSPLAIFFQRMLLLDSIMVFWVLLSLDLLLDGWGRLSRVALSGLCFGLACMAKETAVFFFPAFVLAVFLQRWRHQGRFAVAAWLLPAALVVSWYPLYAALKGELLPAGQALQFAILNIETGSHVSLVDALRWQASRGGGGMFNLDNHFWRLVREDWLARDPVLFVGGAAAMFANLVRGWRDRRALVAGLAGVMILFYLARGGLVFDYYVLAALPFMALNLALLAQPLLARLPIALASLAAVSAAGALIAGYLAAGTLQPLFAERPSQAGRELTSWIKQNVPPESRIVIRDDVWTDLHEPGLGGPAFPNAHGHWKVGADPVIRDGVFHGDWRTVDYVVAGPGFEETLAGTGNQLALDALRNAHLVRSWTTPPGNTAVHPGTVVELWKVDKPGATETALLAGSHRQVAARFERDGAYVGPDGTVTSENQAYALLRSVWSDDRAAFDRAWSWTRRNLQRPDGLLAWLWRGGAVADRNAAADADVDAALALLMAGRRWHDPALVEAGTRMARAIWQHEVVEVQGRPYLAAGDWAAGQQSVALNPSYFAPYAFHVFAEADPAHDWLGLVDSSYRVLFDASVAPLGAERSAGLPPDWVSLDRATGELVPLRLDGRADTTGYGYDAARTYWRVALHLAWTGDGRARSYLEQAGFLRDEVARKGFVSAVYGRDGRVVDEPPSMVATAGAVAALGALDPPLAHRLHAGQVVGQVARSGDTAHWGRPEDLYSQEWGWFATALYAGALPDLWHTHA